MSKGSCFGCGEEGHWARDCPAPRRKGGGAAPAGKQQAFVSKRGPEASSGEPAAKRMRLAAAASSDEAIRGFTQQEAEEELYQLSPTQEAGISACLDDMKNVFITGSAGVGKSFLLRRLLSRLRSRGCVYYATASTGAAAVAIQGTTLHAFAGIGISNDSVEVLVRSIRKNSQACERWVNCRCLIIDEISMIDGHLLDKLEEIARIIRGNSEPFGGIRLVFCGDFFQLPPVPRKSPTGFGEERMPFAFESAAWKRSIQYVVLLTEPFRQADPEFVRLLEAIRCGGDGVVAAVESINRSCLGRRFEDGDFIQPTTLYPHRASVDNENARQLAALEGELKIFEAHDEGQQPFLSQLQSACNAPAHLELKVGAQVVLLKNLDLKQGLCNGSRGRVIGFSVPIDPSATASSTAGGPPPAAEALSFPIVQFVNGVKKTMSPCVWEIKKPGARDPSGAAAASRIQIPLMLAWALSVHKCQGMTLDRVRVDLRQAFTCGQVYVAISRARSLEGLQLMERVPSRVVCASKIVKTYYKNPY